VTKLTVAVLLLLSASAFATDPKSADYTVTIHVTSSRIALQGNEFPFQELNVTIDGKKFELRCRNVNSLLPLGDYKAKLLRDEHSTAHDSSETYEFLFADKKTRKYDVVGISE
jgi:hypothetical protein